MKIENVVASVTLNHKIDLNAIYKKVPGVEYKPEQFTGLVFRLKKPKTATLIFSSGKMVCTGAKSEEEVHRAIRNIIDVLRKHGIEISRKPEIQVQNIVASASLGSEVDLEKAVLFLENVMYEPEQFPGLIYRMEDPKVVLLIFSSGKMVCTGAKSESQVHEAVKKIYKKLKELNLLYE